MQELTFMCIVAIAVVVFGVIFLIGTFKNTPLVYPELQDELCTNSKGAGTPPDTSLTTSEPTLLAPTVITPTVITPTQVIVARAGGITLICVAVAFAFLQCLNVQNNLNAYVYLGSIVSEEYQLLTDAKSGPLDDAPSVIDIQNAFIADVTRLNEFQKRVEWTPRDFICQQMFPKLLQEYNKVPDFSFQLQAYAEDGTRLN